MAISDDRKKCIMEHLARSTGDFTKSKRVQASDRQRQIMDHIRRTKG